MPRRAASIALAAVTAATAAACGGDTEPLSVEELISRGDEICAEGRRAFAEAQARAPASAKAAAGQTDELVQIAIGELDELRGIRPPDELRERYDAYLEAQGLALKLLERGRVAAEEGDARAYRRAQARAAAEQPERLKLARAVGFKQCSKR